MHGDKKSENMIMRMRLVYCYLWIDEEVIRLDQI